MASPPSGPVPGVTRRVLVVVAAGGAVGSLARYGLELAVPTTDGGLPLATLLTNLVGCLLIGVVAARVPDGSTVRAFAGAGVLGGFTTFSTFTVGTDALLSGDAPVTAAAYVLVSVVGGTAAAWCGGSLGRSGRAPRDDR